MNLKEIVFFLLIISFSNTFCQVRFKSKVVSSDNKAIPFANIYIKNTATGVVSNEQGVFDIFIDKKFENHSLVISCVGFKSTEVLINKDILKREKIVLESSDFLLDEVVLNSKRNKQTGKEIVKKAFERYYDNFPTEPYVAKGFIRHFEKTKKEYKWLVEAAIEKYDPSFKEKSKNIKTNVLNVRKSLDNRVLDTLDAYQWYLEQVKGYSIREAWIKTKDTKNVTKEELSKAIDHFDNYFSLPGWKKPFFLSLFSTDINKIRYYNQKKATLKKNDLFKKFQFKLDTIITGGNDDVYNITISTPIKSFKRYGRDFVNYGRIKIRARDYAILEFELTEIVSDEVYKNFSKEVYGTKIKFYLKLKFIDFNGKMYMNYLYFKTPKINRLGDVFRKSKETDIHYFVEEEIMFTEFLTNRNEVLEKLNQTWDNKLFGSDKKYNKDFWTNHNFIPNTPEQEKMIKKLEKEIDKK